MLKLWTPAAQVSGWARGSNRRSVDNARGASTELSRLRVEREEVEIFLRDHGVRRAPAVVRRPA